MNSVYEDYIKSISFRIYKPHMNTRGYARLSSWLQRLNLSLEVLNTRLPRKSKSMKDELVRLSKMPKMSTYAIGGMINMIVSSMPNDEYFVNVGVWNGFTFLAGLLGNENKRCIGVDNFSEFGGPRDSFYERFTKLKSSEHYFFDMDYANYFKNIHQGQIGFYIYDGEHSYDNQLRALEIAEPFFSDECVILVDDTNWDDPRRATLDFISRSPNTYKIIFDITTHNNHHPTLWNGVMILQKHTANSLTH